ncbi:uncharacterized protein LY89DRAFT_727709 [Mollisia scopiformis]|uniref:Uncharacterized protein n=1 Tax=Mollisia scopiformis TaxID=149040 RepID=A0A194XWZ9_MOLSC|nr:uncharacterized protein LY89DRAFT_727709 [Mollisia scopiformis]KUJ24691.1 hypothetical protein LY89DRAFT_727709 [Mollisia scopiformis]
MAFSITYLLAITFAFVSLSLTASIPGLKATTDPAIFSGYGSNYTSGKMTFNGTIHGVDFEMNGTAQEIYARFTASYPEIVALHPPEKQNDTYAAFDNNPVNLDKRSKMLPPLCIPVAGQNWQWTLYSPIDAGIKYLKNLQGGCAVGARSCVRISCSYNGAIYLCNDNNYAIAPSCYYLATYAEDISRDCWIRWHWKAYVGGQEFDTDNYNVVVRLDVDGKQTREAE